MNKALCRILPLVKSSHKPTALQALLDDSLLLLPSDESLSNAMAAHNLPNVAAYTKQMLAHWSILLKALSKISGAYGVLFMQLVEFVAREIGQKSADVQEVFGSVVDSVFEKLVGFQKHEKNYRLRFATTRASEDSVG